MAILLSTKLKNELLAGKSIKDLLQGTVIKIYNGTPPSSADDPVSGALLCTITRNGTSFTKHSIKVTFNPGTSTSAVVRIPAFGYSFDFNISVVGGATTFSDALVDLFKSLAGITPLNLGYDPATTITGNVFSNIESVEPDTVDYNSFIITAKLPGVPLDINAVVVSSSASDATITITQQTASSGGLSFEDKSLVSNGVLEKIPTDIWSGQVLVSGTATYARICFNDDNGEASTDKIRLQGICGTSLTSDFRLTHLTLTQGETITCNNFAIRIV